MSNSSTMGVRAAGIMLAVCMTILITAEAAASWIQSGMGRVEVSNVTFFSDSGILIRAKLLKPTGVNRAEPAPGVVYTHGYQNNRETSDPYCIELARRGFVALCIDAIGRGNSGNPKKITEPDFDPTYGVATALKYIKSLPFVKGDAVGLMGHSLGSEMSYIVAVKDSTVKALAFSGFAYTAEANRSNPRNMLMIFGKYDEYRTRMTGTSDFEKEWMQTERTLNVFPVPNPQTAVTYGDFQAGTARRVVIPPITHIQESHDSVPVAEAVAWMKNALQPDEKYWLDSFEQIWPIKEAATLVAMLACFACLLPLSVILLNTRYFQPLLNNGPANGYSCTLREYIRHCAVNALLMWLYLPLILILFAIHLYIVPIDGVFPMMLVNGIVWWFLLTNLAGFFIMRAWKLRRGVSWMELGASDDPQVFRLNPTHLIKTVLLGFLLFLFVYLLEAGLEAIFIVDLRWIFPFASDMTPYRWLMFALYFPFLLAGFIPLGMFLHGQIRRLPQSGYLGTFAAWSGWGILAIVGPIIIHLLLQYVPIFTLGFIPFVGPGGVLTNFVLSLFHIACVMIMVIPISVGCYQLTGRIYLGAVVSAALVAWMFTSSQVIAPIPV